ncbi:MAG TPA: outer membrane beta-barrel protein [Thermoanaerobaculia bacterium]
MRKFALLFLILIPTTLFAQPRDEGWREDRRYSDTPSAHAFEITPFAGYRWGGTIFGNQTFLFNRDVDVASSANFGANFALPLGSSGLKLELMANRQSSDLEIGGRLFEPDNRVAGIDVTYLHAGLQIPFARSRNATPYFIVSGGLASLDPDVAGISAENRFSASAGLGVKVPMSRALSVRFEGRGYYTSLDSGNDDCLVCDYFFNEDFTQGEVNMGLVFSF